MSVMIKQMNYKITIKGPETNKKHVFFNLFTTKDLETIKAYIFEYFINNKKYQSYNRRVRAPCHFVL